MVSLLLLLTACRFGEARVPGPGARLDCPEVDSDVDVLNLEDDFVFSVDPEAYPFHVAAREPFDDDPGSVPFALDTRDSAVTALVDTATHVPLTHIADSVLSPEQLPVWRSLEGRLHAPLGPVGPRRRTPMHDDWLPTPSADAAFLPAESFRRPLPGFAFQLGPRGLGYYRLSPSASPVVIRLADHVPAPAASPPPPAPPRRPARHARLPDHRRLRRPRRQPRARLPPSWPTSASLQDDAWRVHGCWAIDTINANSWTTAKTVIPRSAADVILLQETKTVVRQHDPLALPRAARRLGWSAAVTSALPVATHSASGGTMVASRRGYGLSPLPDPYGPDYDSRVGFAWSSTVCKGGVIFGSIWLKDSEGLSDTNHAILAHVVRRVSSARGPWVLGGDWNITPQQLRSTSFLDQVNGVIVAPDLPTCHQSVYDFFVVARGLLPSVVTVQRLDDAGTSPHFPSRLILRGDARRPLFRALRRPRGPPGTLPLGPLPAPPSEPRVDIVTAEQLNDSYAQWYEAANAQWSSLVGVPLGGPPPQFVWQAPLGPRAECSIDTCRLASQWRRLAVYLEELVHYLRHPRQGPPRTSALAHRLLRHAFRLARGMSSDPLPEAASVMPWLHRVAHCLATAALAPLPGLVHLARRLAARIDRRAASASQQAWRFWLRGGDPLSSRTSQPHRRAFQYLRGQVSWSGSPIGDGSLIPETPDEIDLALAQHAQQRPLVWSPSSPIPLSDQADIDLQTENWAALWHEDCTYSDPFDQVPIPPCPPLVVDALRTAVLTFPIGTGCGADNIAPRALARLPSSLLSWLARILTASERLGHWPSAMRLVIIVLLPKPDGGRRPIGLLPLLARLWGRARVLATRQWEASHALPALFAGPGMGAQRAAWQAAFRGELAGHQDLAFGQTLLDLVKCFETLPHHHIVRAALKHGFDLSVLRLSLVTYRGPRAIGSDAVYGRLTVASRGVTAGSTFATTELRLLLLDLVHELSVFPGITLTLYVDDATLEAQNQCELVMQATLAAATDLTVQHFTALGLDVSPTKSVVVAGRPRHAQRVVLASRSRALRPVRATKLLGTPSAGYRRRSVAALRSRIRAFRARLPRLHRLRGAGLSARRLVTATGPLMVYGTEIVGMSPTHLLSARRVVAAAVAPATAGKSVNAVLQLADATTGTVDPAFAAHVLPIKTWALALWQRWQPVALMQRALALADARLARAVVPWNQASGPAAALLLTLRRLGWAALSATSLRDDLSATYDLLLDPPAVVQQAVVRSVRRWQFAQLLHEFPGLRPLVPDIVAPPAHLARGVLDLFYGFTDIVHTLAYPHGRARSSAPSVPSWSASVAPSLRSAYVGGQWPQARRAQVPSWGASSSCLLCDAAVGTLEHRHQCPVTRPPGGWPPPPAPAARVTTALAPARAALLRTRGLLCCWARLPPPPDASVSWLLDPPDLPPDDATWFIDGSLFDLRPREARRVGWAAALVASDGSLLACMHGTAPPWATDAAGGELWAYYMVLIQSVTVPYVVTDCKGITDALRSAPAHLVGPDSMLARTWHMVLHALDHDLSLAVARTLWMPAHVTARMLVDAPPSDSRGSPITPLMWRANRLVDAAAKSAALAVRLPRSTRDRLTDTASAVRHSAALLGVVTHAASHVPTVVVRADGTSVSSFRRDSAGFRPPRPSSRPRPTAPDAPPAPPRPSPSVGPPSPPLAARQRSAALFHTLQVQRTDMLNLARIVAARSMHTSAPASLSAKDRLLQVRERVLQRAALRAAAAAEVRRADGWLQL